MMKFLAALGKRRPWVLIPIKELFYAKTKARLSHLAFIYQSHCRLTNGRTHSHICRTIYSKIPPPTLSLILPQWQKTKLKKKKKRSSIKASFKESYRLENFLD